MKFLKIFFLSLFVLNGQNINNIDLESKIERLKIQRKANLKFNLINPFRKIEKKETPKIIKPKIKSKPKRKVRKEIIPKVEKNSFELFSIFNDKAKINENWYSLGDFIGNYKIVKIEKETVTLQKKNIEKTLNFKNSDLLSNITIVIKND